MVADYEIRRVGASKKESVALALYKDLRTADIREMGMAGVAPYHGVRSSLIDSDEVWEAYEKKDKGVIAVWGIRRVMPEEVSALPDDEAKRLTGGRLIWCLGTERISRHKIAFAMESKRILNDWAKEYGLLWNYVANFNVDAMEWLMWCGAEFSELEPWRGHRYRFLRFEIRSE